jgi:ATP-dependent DNA ligase
LVEQPPERSDWVHEVKHDGYRTQRIVQTGRAKAFTRRGFDWSEKYRPIVAAAAELPARSAILDGEMIMPTASGSSDFQTFRRAIKGRPDALAFVACDLLRLDGGPSAAAVARAKGSTGRLVAPAAGAIQYVEHVACDGMAFHQSVGLSEGWGRLCRLDPEP